MNAETQGAYEYFETEAQKGKVVVLLD